MAKFFNILAASVGSGLVLGASIRLGEALGSKLKAETPEEAGRTPRRVRPASSTGSRYANPASSAVISRLDHLEEKLSRALSQREPLSADSAREPEWPSVVASVMARIDRQQSDVDAIRQQVAKATRMMDSAGDIANHLRSDLHTELSRNLDERLAAVEARVHLSMEASQAETLNAMVAAMENRVTPRMIRMESEIAGQTAAVTELRECALQSERSIQRLLGVLERVMDPAQTNSTPPKHGGTPQGEPEQQPGNGLSRVAAGPAAEGSTGDDSPAGISRPMPYSFALFNPIS